MVKPARLGSSVGMTLAHGPAERPAALETAFAHDTLVLVEAYLAGARELEVSVVGNDPAGLELYGPGEIVAGHEFYDYEAKYRPGLSETSPAAEVDAATAGDGPQASPATRTGRSAPRASPGSTSCSTERGLYLSEINTIPGFTPISLFPAMAAAGGYTFGALCRADRRARARAPGGRRPAPR